MNHPKSMDASCFRSQSLKARPTIPTHKPSLNLKVQAIPIRKLGPVSIDTAYFGLFGSVGPKIRLPALQRDPPFSPSRESSAFARQSVGSGFRA